MDTITDESKENRQNIVFFIGSGFTKAVVNTAPLGHEFFIKAFDAESLHDDPQIKNVQNFIENIYYPLKKRGDKLYPNIEDVLSLLDYTIQKKEALSKDYLLEDLVTVRNNLIYLIGKVIKNIEEAPPEAEKLKISREFVEKVQKLLEPSSDVSIISTNYDLIIDNALLEKAESCDYGINLRYNLTDNYTDINHRPEKRTDWDFYNLHGTINIGKIPLLKIHGSLNWFYCPKCDELDVTISEKGIIKYLEKYNKFFCVNPYCTSNYEPLIVTPTMLKVYDNTFLQQLWDLSEEKLSEANKLIFIGYSLTEADYHIRSLLTKALANNKNKDIQIIVVTKHPEGEKEKKSSRLTKKKYAQLFGKKRVNFQPIGLNCFLKLWDDFFNQDEVNLLNNH